MPYVAQHTHFTQLILAGIGRLLPVTKG